MFAEPFHVYPEYLQFVAQTKTLRNLFGWGPERMTWGIEEGSYGLFGAYVTANYFVGLGVQVIQGRGFTESNDRSGDSGLVAVISYRVWQEQFRQASDIIGRQVSVNGHPATVIGVTAPEMNQDKGAQKIDAVAKVVTEMATNESRCANR